MNKRTNRDFRRQAVVIIHGMGEQSPNATLRSFVKGITAWIKNFDPYAERPRYWNRPDSISELYETRKITMEAYAGNVKTDFYEFYWAHHMRNNTWKHLLSWSLKIATTWVARVPPRLRNVWWTVWIFLTLLAGAGVYAGIHWKKISAYFSPDHADTIVGGGITLSVILYLLWKFVLPLVISSLKGTILNSAGDAARYMNPKTFNIEERSTIRREGIKFLKKLHERTEKKYDKIIVVGHSLGSVVAYDLIRLLWQEYHESFDFSPHVDHDVFDLMAQVSSGEKKIEDIDKFQDLQEQCWHQYRNNGSKWLISDFITCAGAIAHIDYYNTEAVSFEEKVEGKEIPVCPPVLEKGDRSLLFGEQTLEGYDLTGQKVKRTVKFLNHAAVFAVTRWTNVYFTSDYVGSNASRIFRKGVKDIAVPRKGLWFFPKGHTNYWDADANNAALEKIARAIGFTHLPLGKHDTDRK